MLHKSLSQYFKKNISSSFAGVIKSAISVSPLSIIRLACGFLRSKISAVVIGVAGVGLLGQANQFLILITTIGSLGMVNSLMQQLSFYRENNDVKNLRLVKGTVLTSQCLFLGIFILVALFAFKPLTHFFFNNDNQDLAYLILIICITSPLNVLASNYIEGFFTAYHRFDLYVKASSIVTVLNLIVFIPAVYYWKAEGGLVSIICGEVLLFIIFLYYVLAIEKWDDVFLFRFDHTIFRFTFRDGIVNLICAFLAGFIGLLLRQMVIKDEGEFSNGIYQFCLSITAYYTPFLTNLLWAKYFPMISARKDTAETRDIIKNTLSFIVIAGSVVTACILIFSNFVIKVLATGDFISAEQYLPIQFIGDFWYFIFYIYSVFLLGMRYIKKYLFMWVSFLVLQYLFSKLLIVSWGLSGVIAGYSISSIILGGISLYFFKQIIASSPSKTYYNVFVSFVFLTIEVIFALLHINIIFRVFLLIAWVYWFARPVVMNKLNY